MTNSMNIENAAYGLKLLIETGEYVKDFITATIDGIEMSVPLDPANRHFSEIMRQVEEGTLVIQEAEPLTGNE